MTMHEYDTGRRKPAQCACGRSGLALRQGRTSRCFRPALIETDASWPEAVRVMWRASLTCRMWAARTTVPGMAQALGRQWIGCGLESRVRAAQQQHARREPAAHQREAKTITSSAEP